MPQSLVRRRGEEVTGDTSHEPAGEGFLDGWAPPDVPPKLTPACVDIWATDLRRCESEMDCMASLLSPEETGRAKRFLPAVRRAQFIVGRAMLRTILAHYLKSEPESLDMRLGNEGKPYLAWEGSSVSFNLAHSGDAVVAAFSLGGPVGVDVEKRRDNSRCMDLAKRFFHPNECEYLLGLPEPERYRAFLSIWTAKEAYIKSRGEGMHRVKNVVCTDIHDTDTIDICITDTVGITTNVYAIRNVRIGSDYSCAVASALPNIEIRRWLWLPKRTT
jgi:4'-phosphopantetheinyl transferase